MNQRRTVFSLWHQGDAILDLPRPELLEGRTIRDAASAAT
jgi:hypothetical protein